MTASPETHASLILRLHDRSHQQAWCEFVEIYQPVIYRLARYKGLQHADAEDVVQQVLSAVAGAVGLGQHLEGWRGVPAMGCQLRLQFSADLRMLSQ